MTGLYKQCLVTYSTVSLAHGEGAPAPPGRNTGVRHRGNFFFQKVHAGFMNYVQHSYSYN